MKTKPPTRKTRRGASRKGSLAIIGTLLLLSGGIRLVTEAGQVIASEESTQDTPNSSSKPVSLDLARPEHLTVALNAIKQREARLIERETEIDKRETALAAAEEAIDSELEKLELAEKSLRETISLAATAAEDDLSQLTAVYANMKPKQAAALFEKMDSTFAAGFLGRMASDSAARIMAGMTPEKAYEISVELAGRNADVPLE